MTKRAAKTERAFRNRIVRQAEADPGTLMPNPKNWRKHPDFQKLVVSGALESMGWIQSVIVNTTTGNLIDGHLRVALALERKEPLVPVTFVTLTEAEEREALATLDPIAALAEQDSAALIDLTRGMKVGADAVDVLISQLRAQAEAALKNVIPRETPGGGTHTSGEFWPVIRVRIPEDVYELWKAWADAWDGNESGAMQFVLKNSSTPQRPTDAERDAVAD